MTSFGSMRQESMAQEAMAQEYCHKSMSEEEERVCFR